MANERRDKSYIKIPQIFDGMNESPLASHQNPLTPSFPVERQKELLRVHQAHLDAKKHIAELTKNIFPSETLSDGITIHAKANFKSWRPNNYRLKIPSKSGSIGNLYHHLPTIPLFPVGKSGKGVVCFKISDNVTLQVGTKCLVAIYSLRRGSEKLYFKVPEHEFDAWLDWKVQDIEAMLLEQVKKLELPLDYEKRVWIKHEDDIHGDEFIDNLPANLFLNDTYFKKVYPKGVEFKSPFYVKNYIANRSLEKVAPEISKELQEIKDKIELLNPLLFLKQNVHYPDDVLCFEDKVHCLSDFEKADFSDWMFLSDCGRGRL